MAENNDDEDHGSDDDSDEDEDVESDGWNEDGLVVSKGRRDWKVEVEG